MDELEIRFNMVKVNGEDFTDDEIDKFNDDFIELVEKYGYLVGGSIGPYGVDDNECTDDEEFFDMGEGDIEYPSIDPDMKGPREDELNDPLNGKK